MPGEWDSAEGGGGGMSGAQGMGCDPLGIQAGFVGAPPERAGDGVSGDRLEADLAAEESGEQRSGDVTAQPAPSRQGGDRVSLRVVAAGDGDGLPVSFLVGFRPANRDQQAVGLLLHVEQGKHGQFGAAQRGGVAEQDDRGVPDPERSGAVDPVEDLADVGGGQRSGQPAGCCAVGAAQPEADLADGLGGHRIGRLVHPVDVPDCSAGPVQTGDRDPLGGAFGQVGAQRGGGSPGSGLRLRAVHQRAHWRQV